MPELPEVETVRKGLDLTVSGKKIEKITIMWPKIIESTVSLEDFNDKISGQTIQGVSRRGKYLIFILQEGVIISHLRMEGKYDFYPKASEKVHKYTHVIFTFTDQSQLHYNDVRKFGRMTYLPNKQVKNYFIAKELGPEPLDEGFELNKFSQVLSRSKTMIKPFLLSQKPVVGLGNIYVDEALFQAKIHPTIPANQLTLEQKEALYHSIISVLQAAVEAGGSTIRTYKNSLGELGKFQHSLKVYGQTGQACPNCHTPIEKIKVAQRGTHYCPNCQEI